MAESWTVAPILRYRDVLEAVDAYRDRLGFVIEEESIHSGPGEEGAVYAIARRDGIEIHLGRARSGWPVDPGEQPNALGAYLLVPDVRALHAELAERGADILQPPTVEPWGHLAIVVRDHAGYLLSFGTAP